MLKGDDWAKAVELGRWPEQVRPYTKKQTPGAVRAYSWGLSMADILVAGGWVITMDPGSEGH